MASAWGDFTFADVEPGDFYRYAEGGTIYRLDARTDGKAQIYSREKGPQSGFIKSDRAVQIRLMFKDEPTPASTRLEQVPDALRKLLGDELGAIEIHPEKMTPGEVSMHLEMFHGIYARDRPAGMTPRERGTSLREAHAADHEAIETHGLKPPHQIAHIHDQSVWQRREEKWLRGSAQKTR